MCPSHHRNDGEENDPGNTDAADYATVMATLYAEREASALRNLEILLLQAELFREIQRCTEQPGLDQGKAIATIANTPAAACTRLEAMNQWLQALTPEQRAQFEAFLDADNNAEDESDAAGPANYQPPTSLR